MRRILLIIFAWVVLASVGVIMAPQQAYAQDYVTVVVQPGDTLAKLSRSYCTSWQSIYDINRQAIGPNPNRLEPGTVLTVPNGCGSGVTPPSGGVYDRGPRTHATGVYRAPYYSVAWGDTLTSIAGRFGLSVAALQQANGIGSTVYAGQVLVIPGSGPTPPQPPPVNAERVYFGSGGIAATRTGVIVNGAPKSYILGGGGGQVMEINTRSHGDPLTVSVSRAGGGQLSLNGPNGGVENNLWVQLPATDDYIVTVSSVGLPEGPQLTFDITFVIQ